MLSSKFGLFTILLFFFLKKIEEYNLVIWKILKAKNTMMQRWITTNFAVESLLVMMKPKIITGRGKMTDAKMVMNVVGIGLLDNQESKQFS